MHTKFCHNYLMNWCDTCVTHRDDWQTSLLIDVLDCSNTLTQHQLYMLPLSIILCSFLSSRKQTLPPFEAPHQHDQYISAIMGREYSWKKKTHSTTQQENIQKALAAKLASYNKENIAPYVPKTPVDPQNEVQQLQEANTHLKKKFRIEHQRGHHHDRKTEKLTEELREMKEQRIPDLERELTKMKGKVAYAKIEIRRLHEMVKTHKWRMQDLQQRFWDCIGDKRALNKRCNHAAVVLAQAVERTQKHTLKKSRTFAIIQKGIYTAQAWTIARFLVSNGCNEKKVRWVIQSVGTMMGIRVMCNMSQQMVQRCITEGGIAAKMQAADEMANADSTYWGVAFSELTNLYVLSDLTFSSNGMTHRHTNYESWTFALWTSQTGAPKLHTLGVDSSVDHTSETQLKGLQLPLNKCSDLYNASPLAQKKQTSFSWDEFITKLCGTNGDHAADQKQDHALLHAWKKDVHNQQLGEKRITWLPIDELIILLMTEKEKRINELRGITIWESLTLVDQLHHDKGILVDLSHELGGQEYETLPEPEKWKFDLFLWVGCCMHKDLNTVKGGDKAMSKCWKSSSLTSPILFANKDNTAILASTIPGSELSAAEICAEKVSRHGSDETGDGH